MTLNAIRLELARTKEFPEGSGAHGYDIVAPLDAQGGFDAEAWKASRAACRVRRFWGAEDDQHGLLIHRRDRRWAFSYVSGEDDDDEPLFKLEAHRLKVGEYVSVTEQDGETRPFRIVSVRPVPTAPKAS
jgi:hypothetical protein